MKRLIQFCSIYDDVPQFIPAGKWHHFKGSLTEVYRVTKRPGCYAIYCDNELVYIGQADNLQRRFLKHFSLLISSIETQWGIFRDGRLTLKIRISKRYGEEAMVEKRLIRRLRPKWNKRGLGQRNTIHA